MAEYIVAIEDINTGEVEEKEFESLEKAEALCRMIDMMNGQNKIVEIFNKKGEKIAHKDIKLRTFISQEKGRAQDRQSACPQHLCPFGRRLQPDRRLSHFQHRQPSGRARPADPPEQMTNEEKDELLQALHTAFARSRGWERETAHRCGFKKEYSDRVLQELYEAERKIDKLIREAK